MHRTSALVRCLLACAVLNMAGCVSWYRIEGIAAPPAQGALPAPTRVALEVSFYTKVKGAKTTPEQRQEAAKEIKAAVEEVFAESKRYEVAEYSAPYTLSLEVTNKGEVNWGVAVLCGVTLMAFPGWSRDDYVTDAVLKDSSGRVLASHTYHSSLGMVIQILLLPAAPFVLPKMQWRRMMRALSEQMVALVDDARLHERPLAPAAAMVTAASPAGTSASRPSPANSAEVSRDGD